MAHKLDVPVSTVQGWKQRDAIPENRAADILAAARSHDVDLSGIGEAASADDNDGADNVEADADTGPDLPAPTPSPVIERADRGVGGDRGAFIIAVIALIVAVGVGGWTLLGRGTSTDPAVQGDIAEITDRLENLETNAQSGASDAAQRQFAADLAELRAELDRMAAGLDEISAPSADVGELESRLRATEAQLGQVQRKAANDAQAATTAISAAQDEIAQMRTQLATLGENSTSTDQDVTGAVGLALAAGRLQRAMDNGAPYQDILEDLRSLSPGDDTLGAILDRLAEQAATGAPTRDVLAQTFAGVARDVIDAAGIQSAGGWTDRT
ncbi:MAG: hypothetical protein OER92_03540, partial [Alphaproteobacteria bacterium]|nr:hypothetical protein [Alphaproteobacteria bacterium]